jgi:hypothetical protein
MPWPWRRALSFGCRLLDKCRAGAGLAATGHAVHDAVGHQMVGGKLKRPARRTIERAPLAEIERRDALGFHGILAIQLAANGLELGMPTPAGALGPLVAARGAPADPGRGAPPA